MSEDKAEITGNNDLTEELEVQKAPTTQVMLEAVLGRMNEGFAEIRADIAQLKDRVGGIESTVGGIESTLHELRAEMAAFREDTAKNFNKVNNKFSLINDRILDVEASQKMTAKQVEELERKAS
jgi:chromosome segregation ATPase